MLAAKRAELNELSLLYNPVVPFPPTNDVDFGDVVDRVYDLADTLSAKVEESKKIMNAQASRGVDFEEGTLKEKVTQIISLLIPISFLSL